MPHQPQSLLSHRSALVLGHVDAVHGNMVYLKPMHSTTGKLVHRHREKILQESELSKHDIVIATACGGHMPRQITTSHSVKAEHMGLQRPTQFMGSKEEAKAAHATREVRATRSVVGDCAR